VKILQIIQRPQFRGAEIFACQLAEQLQLLGHTVHVIFLFGQSHPFEFDIPFHFLQADENKRWHNFSAYKRLSKFINEHKFDLVQANAGDTLKYAALAKKIYGFKAKLVFRNANKLSDFIRTPIQKWLNQQLVYQLQGVASVSELCKADFEKTFHTRHLHITYLPIGVSPQAKPYHNWKQANLPFVEGDNVFVHVGSFVPEKNHVALLRIFGQIALHIPNIKLLLIGTGKTEKAVKAFVNQSLDIKPDNVFFAGNRTDVQQILPLCKALLLPSLIEGLPAVILEAMLAKVTVIANNVGGISEVIKHGDTGYLTTPNDEPFFTECCLKVLQSQNGSNSIIVDNAFTLVTNTFSNITVASKFEQFYHKILAQEPLKNT
jgi:L-malate glycosyltransferase